MPEPSFMSCPLKVASSQRRLYPGASGDATGEFLILAFAYRQHRRAQLRTSSTCGLAMW